MTEYLTEQEQIQQLKNWFKQYGVTILMGVLLALAITTGWRYWEAYREKILTHASNVYDEMLVLRAQGNLDGAMVQANKILTHYPRTSYAQIAAFMLARDAVLKKNYEEALTQLNWVINHSKDKAMREIARLRAARIYITQNKPEAAITQLTMIEDNSFIGLINEVKGDAYLAMNNLDSARSAYQKALQDLPNAEVNRPILQMKLDNLAKTVPSS